MTTSQEQERFGRDPKLWTVTAVKWVLENPSRYEILGRWRVKSPRQEQEITSELETVEAPDLERAVAAAHALLDKHAHEAGDLGVEIYLHAARTAVRGPGAAGRTALQAQRQRP